MACIPVAIHTSVSCMLGLGYGCGYVTSLASYEIFNKRKNKNKDPENNKPIELVQQDISKNIFNDNKFTVTDLLNTLDEVKAELQYTREKIELFDNKLDENINNTIKNTSKNTSKNKKDRTKSF
tara:strand:+ start:95 stop:466 length:372 start_codon:yes stop_codon:yes gene_type:complete